MQHRVRYKIIYPVVTVWLLLFIGVGISFLVGAFGIIKHGLPGDFGNQNYIRDLSDVDAEIKDRVNGMDWSDNYVLAVWRGEWWEYYISRNHIYVTNGYSIADGWIAMVVTLIVGTLPLIGLVFHWIHSKKLQSISCPSH